MAIHLASKTLAKIEEAIQADQGASFRAWSQQILPHMGDAYRTDEFPFRSHMGASGIGDECARKIWYGFRWATRPSFGGRILRLFNRGHLEEARFIAMLLMIGCEVYQQDADGNQFTISDAEGHFGGSGDGIVVNLPDLPFGTQALCEFKTSAEKGFLKLKKEGVRENKPEHYVQMQCYMRKMGIAAALYMVVNKNTDELYGEIIMLDTEVADHFINRGQVLVWKESAKSVQRISESPSWYQCKFCDHNKTCHRDKAPDSNCRTCIHSMPSANKKWVCNNQMDTPSLTKEEQLEGCINYERLF